MSLANRRCFNTPFVFDDAIGGDELVTFSESRHNS
jgi:hypothetical protein